MGVSAVCEYAVVRKFGHLKSSIFGRIILLSIFFLTFFLFRFRGDETILCRQLEDDGMAHGTCHLQIELTKLNMLTHHNVYPNMSFMRCASIFGYVFHSKSTDRFGLDSLKCCLNDTNLIIFNFYMQYSILDFRRLTIHCHRCHFLSSFFIFFFLRWKIENLLIVSFSIVSGFFFSGADGWCHCVPHSFRMSLMCSFIV